MGKIHSLVFWMDFAFPVQQKNDFFSFEETPWILGDEELVSLHFLVDENL